MWSLCRTQECDNCRSGFLNATSISINVVCAPTESYILFMFIYIYIKVIVACTHTHTQTNVDVNGKPTFWAHVLSDTAVAENECLIFEKCQKNGSFSLSGGSLQCVLYNILQEPHQSP